MPRNNVFQYKSNQNYDSQVLKKVKSRIISNMAAKVGQVGQICSCGKTPLLPARITCPVRKGTERPFTGKDWRHHPFPAGLPAGLSISIL